MTDSPLKKLFGIEFSDFTKIVLGFVSGALLVTFTSWWNATAPRLVILDSNNVAFHGDKNKLAIITTLIRNDGTKEAEDLYCVFGIKATDIQEVIATPELNPKIAMKEEKTTVTVTNLNAGETLRISFLVNNRELATIPLQARAKGTNAVPMNQRSNMEIFWGVSVHLIPALIGLLALCFGYFFGKKETDQEVEKVAHSIAEAIRANTSLQEPPLVQILGTVSGENAVGGAARNFGPDVHFTRADLAHALGVEERRVFAWIRQLGVPEKRLSYKIFDKHPDGSYSLSAEKHAEVLRILGEGQGED